MPAFDQMNCVVHVYTDRWGTPQRVTVQVSEGPEQEIPHVAETQASLKGGDLPTVNVTIIARLVVHEPEAAS